MPVDLTLEKVRDHQDTYNDFRRRTGKRYDDLQKLYSDAIDATVESNKDFFSPPGYIVCEPETMVYLLELALEHLAAGAALQAVLEERRLKKVQKRAKQ